MFNINYGESMKEMLPFYKKMGKQLITKKKLEKKVDLTDDIDKKLEYSKKLHNLFIESAKTKNKLDQFTRRNERTCVNIYI